MSDDIIVKFKSTFKTFLKIFILFSNFIDFETVQLSFLSFIILGLFGRFLGYRGSLYFAAVCILFANLLSYIICYEVCICDTTSIIHLATWINFDIMQLDFGFYFLAFSILSFFSNYTEIL